MRSTIAKFLDRLILKRRKTPLERMFLSGVNLLRPEWLMQRRISLKDFIQKRRIAIRAPSDDDLDLYRQLQWGDTWAKYELTKAFGEMGYPVTEIEPDVVIHLYGKPTALPANAHKIVWIYSHPDTVTPDLLRRYDRIFCLSSKYTDKVCRMGFDAETMYGATAKTPGVSDIKYDVVFVGNAHADGRRDIVDDALSGLQGKTKTFDYGLKVWGRGYQYLPEKYWAGEYIDYIKLDRLYRSSLITLNDHTPAMAAEGFVAVRVFDILASGGFCISDANPGIDDIFGDTVPQYRTADELPEMIRYYMQNPEKRLSLIERGQKIALSHTWTKRAERFVGGIDANFENT